jgi:hypothetical protein
MKRRSRQSDFVYNHQHQRQRQYQNQRQRQRQYQNQRQRQLQHQSQLQFQLNLPHQFRHQNQDLRQLIGKIGSIEMLMCCHHSHIYDGRTEIPNSVEFLHFGVLRNRASSCA